MMDQENGLPVGWCLANLGCLGTYINGRAFKPKEWKQAGLPIIRIQNLNDHNAPYNYSDDKHEEKYLIKKGDLLVAWSASLGVYIWQYNDAWLNQHIFRVEINSSVITKKFLFFVIQDSINDLYAKAHGSGIVHVTKGVFESHVVKLPPLPEQHRIVAEIEKQFSRLDEAVAGLKRIQANLKRYRASVLKAAVEGRLTAEWRKQHPDTEPAEQLLQRILKERRAYWEQAELEKMQAAGKPPKDDQWKRKYKEPFAPDASDLPTMPEGWVWARLDTIASLKGGITVDKNKTSSDFIKVPYLRVANVQRGYLDLKEIKEILAPKQKIDQLLLKKNDILFNEGGDLDKLGRGWIWEDQLIECIHQNHVFRARLFLLNVEAKFVSWWGNTFGRDYFLREGKQTTNLASINLTKLSCFPIPLPSQQEQTQIVSEVERRLSIADEIEQQINTNLKRAERLRQSILKKAFSGRLVPQDSDDEPASVLLEKIKQAQRA